MKKKIFATLFGMFLLFGGTQVFASTVLNSSIIDIIKDVIGSFTKDSVSEVDSKLEVNNGTLKKAVTSIIEQKESDSQERITKYKEEQLSEAEAEMADYIKQVEGEVDSAISSEEEQAKSSIKAKKDEKVNEFKEELLEEIEKSLKTK